MSKGSNTTTTQSSANPQAEQAYSGLLSQASQELYELAYLAMFAIPIVGIKALRDRMPTWVAWTTGVGFAFTVFSFVLTAVPFVDVVDSRAYAAKILGTTFLANAIGLAFYWARRTTRPNNLANSAPAE